MVSSVSSASFAEVKLSICRAFAERKLTNVTQARR